jgi:lipoate-protein ligase A
MQIRVINTGFHSSEYNYSLDRALCAEVLKSGNPVLKFCAFTDSVAAYNADDFEHGNDIFFSFIIPEDSEFIHNSIEESKMDLSKGIQVGLQSLNIDTEISSEGELLLNGQKILKVVQKRFKGLIIQSGQLLLSPNSAIDLIPLETILEGALVFDELVNLFKVGYENSFKLLKFVDSEVTPAEETNAKLYMDTNL